MIVVKNKSYYRSYYGDPSVGDAVQMHRRFWYDFNSDIPDFGLDSVESLDDDSWQEMMIVQTPQAYISQLAKALQISPSHIIQSVETLYNQ